MEFLVELDAEGRWTRRLMDRLGQALALAPRSYETRADCLVAIGAAKVGLGAPIRDSSPKTV